MNAGSSNPKLCGLVSLTPCYSKFESTGGATLLSLTGQKRTSRFTWRPRELMAPRNSLTGAPGLAIEE